MNNSKPMVSIIVPIYNVEKYLKQCLESIVNQTLENIEIICINDGSPDNCGDIIDEYAKKDSRIIAIHKKNEGYGRTINLGFEMAKGEYIGIIESDDWVDSNMFEKLYKQAIKMNADVCKGDFRYYYGNNIYRESNRVRNVAEENTVFTISENPLIIKFFVSIWSAIYKKEYMDRHNIRMVETQGASYQDMPFAALTYAKGAKITLIHDSLMNYRTEEGMESSSKRTDGKLKMMPMQCNVAKKSFIENGCWEKVKDSASFHFYSASILYYLKSDFRYKKAYFKEMVILFKGDNLEKNEFLNDDEKYRIKLIQRNSFIALLLFDIKRKGIIKKIKDAEGERSIYFFGKKIFSYKKQKYRRIKFYAYRDNNGATGGPGGVNFLQQLFLGNKFKNVKLRYYFKKNFNKFGLTTGAILQVFRNEIFSFKSYYIANDIASAFGLALLNKDYSIIYHQQGPMVEEKKNFGQKLTKFTTFLYKHIEKVALKNAKSVHFPSKGAQDMYFNSEYRSIDANRVKIGSVLPNTIFYNIKDEIKEEPDTLTFLSVGAMTSAKGQDRTANFFDIFLMSYQKPVRWIIVGRGPLKNIVLESAEKLKNKFSNFTYVYIDHCSHEKVIKLNAISDAYIMLHRISIFDLATLEAMDNNNAIILSAVGGNVEFNVNNNVTLVKIDDYQSAVNEFLSKDLNAEKIKNKRVFEKYFSSTSFKDNYEEFLTNILNQDN